MSNGLPDARLKISAGRPELVEEYLPLLRRMGCEADILAWAEGYVRLHAGRIASDVDYLTARHRIRRCLNVGGAPFLFEYLLRKHLPYVELVSLDLDPERFPDAPSLLGIEILAIDIETANGDATGAAGTFDCVVLCEIFEHFRLDLLGTLARVRSLLAEGGLLYLTTPNGVSLAGLKRVLGGNTGPDPLGEWSKLTRLGHMGHVREYSMREVTSILSASGFRIVSRDFRQQDDASWTRRAAAFRPSLGSEIVLVAERC
jgi:hypothetical protein